MWITLIASYYKPLGIMLAMLGLFTVGYYQGYQKAEAAQVKANLAATVHKAEVETKSAIINQNAETSYAAEKSYIGNLYNIPAISLPADKHNLPKVYKPSARIKPVSCVTTGYKLTPQQCDEAVAAYINLNDAWEAQARNQ